MKKLVVAVALALAFFMPAAGKAAEPLTFILAGQSNMVGLAQPVPAETPDANVTVLEPDRTWQPAIDPIYTGGGVGPSIPFGDAVAVATGRSVRLIPCAYSGTRIAEWLPGYTPSGGSDPAEYEPCLAKASGLHVDGVLFYQGESDAILPEWANVWASQFALFVSAIRRDLAEPDLPVVFAQIASGDGWGHDTPACAGYCSWTVVQQQQASVSIAGVAMIRTSDLAVGPDNLHLTASSETTVGARFAAGWLALPPPAPAAPPAAPAVTPPAAPTQTAAPSGASTPTPGPPPPMSAAVVVTMPSPTMASPAPLIRTALGRSTSHRLHSSGRASARSAASCFREVGTTKRRPAGLNVPGRRGAETNGPGRARSTSVSSPHAGPGRASRRRRRVATRSRRRRPGRRRRGRGRAPR